MLGKLKHLDFVQRGVLLFLGVLSLLLSPSVPLVVRVPYVLLAFVFFMATWMIFFAPFAPSARAERRQKD